MLRRLDGVFEQTETSFFGDAQAKACAGLAKRL